MMPISAKGDKDFRRRCTAFLATLSLIAGAVCVLFGLLVFAEWIFDFGVLREITSTFTAVNPTGAFCFILAGSGLCAFQLRDRHRNIHLVWRLGGLAVFLIGALTLSRFIFGSDIGLDGIFFSPQLGLIKTLKPNMMVPNAAFNFMLTGSAIALLEIQFWGRYLPSQYLALLSGSLTLFALTGYGYRVSDHYGLSALIPMALITALGFAATSMGILFARSQRGVMSVVTSNGLGGLLSRRLMPLVFGIPVLGGIILAGQRRHFYSPELGLSFFAVISTVIFLLLIGWQARLLYKMDKARGNGLLVMPIKKATLRQTISDHAAESSEKSAKAS